jgi:MFS family permease
VKQAKWYWAFLLANAAAGGASLLLPLYAHFLGGGAAAVGTISATGSLVGVAASLFWGNLSDRTRRRRVFVFLSFGGIGIVYSLVPLVGTVGGLVLVGSVASFFWMASSAVSVLLIMERFPESEWEHEISRLNAYSGLGWAAGQVLGAAWTGAFLGALGEGLGLKTLGITAGLLGLAGAGLAYVLLPEPVRRVQRRDFRGLVVALGNFLNERFRYGPVHLYYLLRPAQIVRFLQGRTAFGPELVLLYYSTFLILGAFSIFFVPLPVFLRGKLGWPSPAVYGAYVIHTLSSVATYRWARGAIGRWGHRPVLGLGLLARSAAFALFPLAGTILPVWAAAPLFLVTGATWAMFQLAATAMVSRLAPEGFKGQALGAYNALTGLGGALGAVIGGFIADSLGFQAAFLVAASVVFLTIPIVLVEPRLSR